MAKLDLYTCMDIFDWFDDNTFEYINHILTSKATASNASAPPCRLSGSMPAGS